MAEAALGTNAFLWEGTDRKGKKVKGKITAQDEAAVRADLRRQGVVPSRIRKQRKGLLSGTSTITTADIAIFSRQLATLLAAGSCRTRDLALFTSVIFACRFSALRCASSGTVSTLAASSSSAYSPATPLMRHRSVWFTNFRISVALIPDPSTIA